MGGRGLLAEPRACLGSCWRGSAWSRAGKTAARERKEKGRGGCRLPDPLPGGPGGNQVASAACRGGCLAVEGPRPPADPRPGRGARGSVCRPGLTHWAGMSGHHTGPPCQAQTPKQPVSCYSLLGPCQHPKPPSASGGSAHTARGKSRGEDRVGGPTAAAPPKISGLSPPAAAPSCLGAQTGLGPPCGAASRGH